MDEHRNGIAPYGGAVAVNGFLQVVACYDVAWALEQGKQDSIFVRAQCDGFIAFGDFSLDRIEYHIAVAEKGHDLPLASTRDRADPGQQLAQLERFDQVVVGTRVQATDSIAELPPGRQYDDGNRVIALPEEAKHGKPRIPGQPDIEQNGGIGMIDQRGPCRERVADPVDVPRVLPNTIADGFGQHRIVFHQQ